LRDKVIHERNEGKLLDICKRNDIAFLGIFGSYSRGEQKEKSDIDILVRFSRRKSLLDLVRIERQLSEVLDVKVDLVTEGSVSPYLIEGIKKELKVIYDEKG
jgi:hypothetical protein